MRLKLGIMAALLIFIWGCSSAPSNQEQLKQLEKLQASPKASISSSPSPTVSASPSPPIAPSAEASPSIAPEPEKKLDSQEQGKSQPVEPQQNSNEIPLFANCKEAKANGYSNISVAEHPEYASKDRDKDGIACES
ncbi:excalibur calcium-binding domain-containing protein [Cyanobacteria bacterium FACHB-DQ100]|nr:excalibur calcium-binding domain-containing protein [Cyanobacteria bacterium FACHB-DQ100]